MPTSVLLAVLAAAGLLALAPALTRRMDGPERLSAERATSLVRVLSRRRRRRTVPGPRPINPPRFVALYRGGSSGVLGSEEAAPASNRRVEGGRERRRRRPSPVGLLRRRRVLLALVLLNLVELAGVFLVGPGFWIGFLVSFAVLLADLAYLRRTAVIARRARRARVRRAEWVAAQQAAVRQEHGRRAAERQSAVRRAAARREDGRVDSARREPPQSERFPRRAATGTEAVPRQRAGLPEPRAGFERRAYDDDSG